MMKEQVNRGGIRVLRTLLLAALLLFVSPMTAKAGIMEQEQNVVRNIMLDLDKGSTTYSGWACWVDRDGGNYKAGLNWWFIPGSGNIAPHDVTHIPNHTAGSKQGLDGV